MAFLIQNFEDKLHSKEVEEIFLHLYGKEDMENQRKRYFNLAKGYIDRFGMDEVEIFSSPGRTEISGNHTDHNHGKILGGSINLDCISIASKTDDNKVYVVSPDFNQDFVIDLDDLEPNGSNIGTKELVKGILKGFKENGYHIGGFKTYIHSNVIASAGVSSSAAFETLLCQINNTFYNEGKVEKLYYALIGKYAENHYWAKASGLLDQMCCAIGGLVNIDFKNEEKPEVRKVDFDFDKANHSLIIVQTGRGHADLSEEYSSIPKEMKAVAAYFGKSVLAEVKEDAFYEALSKIRKTTGDRAVMRAIHFFNENKLVDKEVESLQKGDFSAFLEGIKDSGNSSWKYLQNCYTNSTPQEQGICVALALTENFVKEKRKGVCRVHGGGFAGVIMAMLPNDIADEYIAYIEGYLGEGSAYKMRIRPIGSLCISKP